MFNKLKVKISTSKHQHLIDFLVLLIFGSITRLLFLDSIPYRLDGDAGWIARDSVNAWTHHIQLFSSGTFGYQNFFFYLNGLFINMFGGDIFAMRLFPAIGGIMAIYATYLLASQLFNRRIALFSSIFLMFLPIHLVWSRNGVDVIHATWLLPLTLYFMYLGITKDSRLHLIAGGFLLGFSQYFHVSGRFIPFIIVFAFFIFVYKRIQLHRIIVNALLLLSAGLVTYAPMIAYYVTNPDALLTRINQVGIVQTHWLSNQDKLFQMTSHIMDAYQILLTSGHPSYFHYASNTFLPLGASVVFAIGLIACFLQRNKRSVLILLFWILGGTFLAGVLTIDIVASRYIILFPAICIVMAVGTEYCYLRLPKSYAKLLLGIFLLYYITNNSYDYWRYETYTALTYDTNTQIASYAGRYLVSQRNYTLYFLGSSNYNYQYFSFNYPSDQAVVNLVNPISSYPLHLSRGKNIFIILPDRYDDLRMLQNLYPSATQKLFTNPQGTKLFYLLESV